MECVNIKDNMHKTKFRWVCIAGADPEPAEEIEIEGRKGILTIGCQDPFWLDEKPEIVIYGDVVIRPKRFLSLEQAEEQEKLWKEYESKPHSWRGPR